MSECNVYLKEEMENRIPKVRIPEISFFGKIERKFLFFTVFGENLAALDLHD